MVSLCGKIVKVCYILHYTCMEIFILGSEILHQKAAPVTNIKDGSHNWKEVVQGMFDALKKGKGIGLAGPQIGLMQQIFVTNVEGDGTRVFINPSIVETSQETVKYEEGCLSVPGVYADVIRPKTVKVQAWNEKGRSFTLEAGGLLARVNLHEYDHLEGILFIDRLSEPKRKKIVDKFAKKAKA
jgi:peptide deformylase